MNENLEIFKRINELKDELITLRRSFHRYPELGFKEFETSKRIVKYLSDLGLEITILAKTGVVGLLKGNNDKPTLLLRSDMDALPINEENNIPYKSNNPDVMHACAHDGHMAMLLIAAKVLAERRREIKGNIKFIFEPSEETGKGAKQMIREGVLENPKVDACIGLHLWSSIKSGEIGIKAGLATTTLNVFRILVKGKGGHTGSPETTIDPIITAANIINSVQLIQTREINPLRPIIIMFGKIRGGTKNNIVPDQIELEGTLRYFHKEGDYSSKKPEDRLKRIVEKVCRLHNAGFEMDIKKVMDTVINDPKMTELIKSTAKNIINPSKIISFTCPASEDFSEFSKRIPSVFYFLGIKNKKEHIDYPQHSSRFNIDEQILPLGVKMHVFSAFNFFNL